MQRRLLVVRLFAASIFCYLLLACISPHGLTDARKDNTYMIQVKCAHVVFDNQPTEIPAYIVYDGSGEYHCTLIPLLQILPKAGWDVAKIDRNTYAISNPQEAFLLSTTDGTIYRQGKSGRNSNYLELPPDSKLKRTIGVIIDDEFYIDTESVSGFLLRSGWKVSVSIDTLTIYFAERPVYVLPSE